MASASLWPLAFQTVVISFASCLIWFRLVRHHAVTRISTFTLLTPPAGLRAGVLLLGEPATLCLIVAPAAVCAGIALVNRAPGPGVRPARYLLSALSASLMPSLTPTPGGSVFSAAAASRSL